MENNNLNVLDEVNKGATMGMDAITFVQEKATDVDFKNVLQSEYNEYHNISKRIKDMYSNYSGKEPHETNSFNRMMTKSSVEMKTMNDNSSSKLAELLLQGTNMGIIEGRRLLNNNPSVDDGVQTILNDFVVMQEQNVETLKKFL